MLPMTAKQFERLTKNATTLDLLACETTATRTIDLYDTYFKNPQTSAAVTRLFVALQKLDREATECRLDGGCVYHRDNEVEGN